jgi:hypothetical protein
VRDNTPLPLPVLVISVVSRRSRSESIDPAILLTPIICAEVRIFLCAEEHSGSTHDEFEARRQ